MIQYPIARIDASCGPEEVWIMIWDKDLETGSDKIIYESEKCSSTREAIGKLKQMYKVTFLRNDNVNNFRATGCIHFHKLIKKC